MNGRPNRDVNDFVADGGQFEAKGKPMNGAAANGKAQDQHLLAKIELQLLGGAAFDRLVWTLAHGAGLRFEHLASGRAGRIYRALEAHYNVEAATPGEPELLALSGLGQQDIEALIEEPPAGSSAAEQLTRYVMQHARQRANNVRLARAIDALQGGHIDLALTLIHETMEPTERAVVTPASVIGDWAEEGPSTRLPTGIAPLDALCGGGLLVPRRLAFVGPPGAGKTALAVSLTNHLARSGVCTGILASDEEPSDVTVRLAQLAGFSISEVESRDPAALQEMHAALEHLPIRFFDTSCSIERAAAEVGAWAKSQGRQGALLLDSIQTIRSNASSTAKNPRELIELNVTAIREASTKHRLLVISTSEANRGSYRNGDPGAEGDLASGAESRGIEYSSETLVVIRTPPGAPDVLHCRVAKNRRALRGEFFLQLDRSRHELTECSNPLAKPSEEDVQAAKHGQLDQDADTLRNLVGRNPGVGELALRGLVKEAGLKWGVDRLNAAKARLQRGHGAWRLVNRGNGGAHRYHVEPTDPGPQEVN